MIPAQEPRRFAQRTIHTQPEELQGWAKVSYALNNLVFDNPMMDESKREMRRVFRTGKAGPIIGIVIFSIIYIWMSFQMLITGSDSSIGFCYIELVLITLIIPASIHNSISGERERQTWDALTLTRLTAGQIIIGKLLWRFRIILIIMVLSLIPIFISRTNDVRTDTTTWMIAASQVMLFLWASMLATFGMWVSSMTKRSITSLAVIVGTLFGVLVLIPGLYNMFSSLIGTGISGPDSGRDIINDLLLGLNPFTCLQNVVEPSTYVNSSAQEANFYYPGINSGLLQSIVYFVISILCGVFVFLRLKKLEKPSDLVRS
jgi:ABC-type transport system involved in multi-copper enzyme maturation permease subunit